MKHLILPLLILAVLVPAHSQQKRATHTAPYTNSVIDLSASKLPPRYSGVDVGAVYTALEKRKKESVKDEFETTTAYQARIERERDQKLVGDVGISDLLPVVVTNESIFERIESTYDADTEELTVKLSAKSPAIGVSMDLEKRALPLKYDFHQPTTYTGVNSYGAKVTVEKQTIYIYSVLAQNISGFASDRPERYSSSSTIVTRLKLSPMAAKAAKENLRAALFIKLQSPFIEQGYLSTKPTIHKPRETFAVYHYLIADIEQIWLYNYETGAVYKVLIPRQ